MTTLTTLEEKELKEAIMYIVKRNFTEDELKLIKVKINSGLKNEPVYLTPNIDGTFAFELNVNKLDKPAIEYSNEDYVKQVQLVFGLVEATALTKFCLNNPNAKTVPPMADLIKAYVSKMTEEHESKHISVLNKYVAK